MMGRKEGLALSHLEQQTLTNRDWKFVGDSEACGMKPSMHAYYLYMTFTQLMQYTIMNAAPTSELGKKFHPPFLPKTGRGNVNMEDHTMLVEPKHLQMSSVTSRIIIVNKQP